MKESDVKINQLVLFPIKGKLTLGRVQGIKYDFFKEGWYFLSGETWYRVDTVVPALLTVEVLTKLGFKELNEIKLCFEFKSGDEFIRAHELFNGFVLTFYSPKGIFAQRQVQTINEFEDFLYFCNMQDLTIGTY